MLIQCTSFKVIDNGDNGTRTFFVTREEMATPRRDAQTTIHGTAHTQSEQSPGKPAQARFTAGPVNGQEMVKVSERKRAHR